MTKVCSDPAPIPPHPCERLLIEARAPLEARIAALEGALRTLRYGLDKLGYDADVADLDALLAATPAPVTPTLDVAWTLRLICCGRDDGTVTRQTWAEADALRRSYIDTASGHVRSAILSRALAAEEGGT